MWFAAEEFRAAIMAAPRSSLNDIKPPLWGAVRAGYISEPEAEKLSDLIEARRAVPPPKPPRVGSRPRSPESIERRRSWAAGGGMPSGLAAKFTLAEQAALAVVADEVRRTGDCRICVGAIAGKAGIGEGSVRNAIREARSLGLVTVEHRRVAKWRNLPNIVTIVSPEWCQWLARKGGGGACKSVTGTVYSSSIKKTLENLPLRISLLDAIKAVAGALPALAATRRAATLDRPASGAPGKTADAEQGRQRKARQGGSLAGRKGRKRPNGSVVPSLEATAPEMRSPNRRR